jgi:hypothetical protein
MKRLWGLIKTFGRQALVTDITIKSGPTVPNRGQKNATNPDKQLPPLLVFIGSNERTDGLNTVIRNRRISSE